MKLPVSKDELIKWVKANKPKDVHYFEVILDERSFENNPQFGTAIWLLIAASFEAGRWFQKMNPETDLLGKNPYEDFGENNR